MLAEFAMGDAMRSLSTCRATFCLILLSEGIALPASVETSSPFQGVIHYHVQSTVPRLVDIHLLEIDPTAAGISFIVTPSNGAAPGETTHQTTREFVAQHSLEIGINGNFYSYSPNAPYVDLVGLAASEGNLYSRFYADFPALNISASNKLQIVYPLPGNQMHVPPFDSGIVAVPNVPLYNAVGGNEYIVFTGQNIASWADGLNPRTAAGITADGKLLLLTVDGRNANHSRGMTTTEVADVLISYGAFYAINLDGGGSSTLVLADPTPRVVNIPVGIGNQPGSERSVGNNLGVHALAHTQPQTSRYVFADFEDGDLGRLSLAPGASGSTQGIDKNISSNVAVEGIGHESSWSQRLLIIDDPAINNPIENPTGGWFVRHLSGSAASRSQNHPRPADGYIGFWAKTDTAGIDASIAIDNTNNVTADRGFRRSLIADGNWHLYQWNLDDNDQWEGWFQGDSTIDSPDFTLDSIMFFGPASNATI
jgi:hypothetical protein